MSKKAELTRKIARLRQQLGKIEDAEAKTKARALEGRYFKYRNCYSCPEKPSDYWWLYAAVTGVKDGSAHSLQFQTDKYGQVIVETEKHFTGNGFMEIPREELRAAWLHTMAKLALMGPR